MENGKGSDMRLTTSLEWDDLGMDGWRCENDSEIR